MKKNYISPVVFQEHACLENMIANSVTGVGGDAGITKGEGEVPGVADIRRRGRYDNMYEDDDFYMEEAAAVVKDPNGWADGLW
jgi:hypothetical protein